MDRDRTCEVSANRVVAQKGAGACWCEQDNQCLALLDRVHTVNGTADKRAAAKTASGKVRSSSAAICKSVCVRIHVLCMYSCIYICMHACMHACMYVCMHVCMHVCMMFICLWFGTLSAALLQSCVKEEQHVYSRACTPSAAVL